ncbi:MAG: histidine kinase dimerization/phosphoacceptor domain -containing protein [Devosia sp.]
MAELAHSPPLAPAPHRLGWPLSAATTVITVAAVLTVIVFGIFGLLCVQGYDATIRGAGTKAQTAADVVAEESSWILGSARTLLAQLAASASLPGDITDQQRAAIDTSLASLPAPTHFELYDASGNVWGDADRDMPTTIADTELFKGLEAGSGWTVSRQMGDSAGEPIFMVAQRLGTDSFGGVAALVISGKLFEQIWAPQQLGTASTTSLIGQDGWLVGRYPALPRSLNLSNTAPFADRANDASGTYRSPSSPADGIARIVSFRRLPELGLVAVAAVSEEAALAGLWTAIITVLWLMVPIALALLVGSLLTARVLRQSQRTQASLAAALNHNEVLFREIHHRVKNNLQSVGALLQMQPISREIKADMGQRIAAMSAVHEHIYRSSNFAVVRVQDYLRTLIDNIRTMHDGPVSVVEDVEDMSLDKDAATPLGLIVNEVVSNAFKHAFPAGRSGTISIALLRHDADHARLTVEDNGVGFDPEAPAKGIGRRLIAALTKQLGGEAEVTRPGDGGSRFVLTFPLATTSGVSAPRSQP